MAFNFFFRCSLATTVHILVILSEMWCTCDKKNVFKRLFLLICVEFVNIFTSHPYKMCYYPGCFNVYTSPYCPWSSTPLWSLNPPPLYGPWTRHPFMVPEPGTPLWSLNPAPLYGPWTSHPFMVPEPATPLWSLNPPPLYGPWTHHPLW